jgi:hypothetical protein
MIGAIALGLLTACSPKPPASLADVVELVAASDWDGAEAAVESITKQATGCELAKGHALASGLARSRSIVAITPDISAREDLLKSAFWAGYENAIAQANKLSDCGFRSITESELEIGG